MPVDPRRRAALEVAAALGCLAVRIVAKDTGWGLAALAILCAAWAAYLLLRLKRHPALWVAWGLGWAPVRGALRLHLPVTLLALLAVILAGWTLRGPLPPVGWWPLAIYPLWALAQEFALQAVFVRGLATLGVRGSLLPVFAGATFGLAHMPDLPLAAIAAGGGTLWTWLWLRAPSTWVVAASHAVLGAAAMMALLGKDPAQEFAALLPQP